MDESALRTLWCGNLSPDVGDEVLFDLFLQAGPLEKVSIPKDRDGRHKGYGFVTFKHECSVPYAMALMKGIALYGKTINLQNRTGARVDNVSHDSRDSYQQRGTHDVDQERPYPGSVPNLDLLQSLSPLLGMSGFLCGNPLMQGLIPQIPQNLMPPPQHQSHQRSRSHNMGDRYYDGNARDDRRDGSHNMGDRYYDGNARDDRRDGYGNRNDRQRSRGNDYRGRPRDDDYHDRSRGNNYRDRDRERDRNRSNNRPYDNRHRYRD